MKVEVSINQWQPHSHWWFDSKLPQAFQIFDNSSLYHSQYFSSGHPKQPEFHSLANHIIQRAITISPEIKTILDIGCGCGGVITELDKMGYNTHGVDGSVQNSDNIHEQIDVRKPFYLNEVFDLGICTEIAEHVECPFSSALVDNIIRHCNLVYFTACPPYINRPHIHHPNEQPMEFWKNIFSYYDFKLIGTINNSSNSRLDGVFFQKNI